MSQQEESVNDRFEDSYGPLFFFNGTSHIWAVLTQTTHSQSISKSVLINYAHLYFKISRKVICIKQNCRYNNLYEVLQA